MKRQSIKADHLHSICWVNDFIVDFASAGKKYFLDGHVQEFFSDHFGFGDASITSPDGQYAFIYQKLGTKGLLLKNGKLIREINRSYYCADVYEFPVTFATINDKIILIHCPFKYCRLDFEDVETGEILTDSKNRNPSDFFHSRLEMSPNGKYLLNKGWSWHPWDGVKAYEIDKCLNNPTLLDNSQIYPEVGTEICTAGFIDDNKILIGSSNEPALNEDLVENLPEHTIAVWDFVSDQISKAVKINGEFGNLFAINHQLAWDLYKYPKIINILNGQVIDKDETISSGLQNSSIIGYRDKQPKLAFNRQTKQIAITTESGIEILSP